MNFNKSDSSVLPSFPTNNKKITNLPQYFSNEDDGSLSQDLYLSPRELKNKYFELVVFMLSLKVKRNILKRLYLFNYSKICINSILNYLKSLRWIPTLKTIDLTPQEVAQSPSDQLLDDN